jgi:hypothetical protein
MADTDNQTLDIVCGKAGANIPFYSLEILQNNICKALLETIMQFSVDVDETFSSCYQIYGHRKHNV